ncbi:IS982 family transposase, partial [Candidatus Protochlamydia sp. W-9]
FKLHLMINEKGEILAFQLTPGNVADVSIAETLSKGIFGKLFGDKGYISKELSKRLLKQGLELFTTLRSNMKQNLMKLTDKILLRKRAIIETVNDQLKNISQIEHTRHRNAG